jgi:RecB family exonuclease
VGNAFSWSLSRHDTFATCKRRYFYAYYVAPDDPEVHRLKKLSALPLWAGSVVHETIESVLKTRDALPSPEEQEAMIRAAVHGRMLGQWRESEAGPVGFRLFEHEYEVVVQAEDKKILVGTVMRSLRNFFRSDVLRDLFAAGRQRWLTVEDLVSFKVRDVEVFLRMDVAYRDRDGRVVIVDWKTGGEDDVDALGVRFQLVCYGLYARARFGATSEGLRVGLALLGAPSYREGGVTGAELDAALARIRASMLEMRSLLADPATDLATEERFPRTTDERRCTVCPFRRPCRGAAWEAPAA